MKRCLFILSMMFVGSLCVIADEQDDIYFNPNRKSEVVVNENTEVVNGRDVDEYNRFGGYYESEIDTIGSVISNGEDFVYTKQIQKYYNPTIVADNAEVQIGAFQRILSQQFPRMFHPSFPKCPHNGETVKDYIYDDKDSVDI